VRTPDGAVCACAIAPDRKNPVKAANVATVKIRMMKPTRKPLKALFAGRRVSDCRAEVNRLEIRMRVPRTCAKRSPMWTTAKAPSLAEMEAMAHEIFERLPRTFRTLCEGVIIRVDDFPTEEVLDELGAESEFDLLGLFQGVGLPHQTHGDIARLPNMIWLYRRPILDYWAEHEETLGHIVRHVLIHEIGHHFGLSDADMEAIEANAG
jgi:predicted Zn-dependent protease with MMP-like domain